MAKTVLVIDDDPFICLALEKFLKSKGLKVLTETDPQKAFDTAEKKQPDLIISDVNMPEVDGFALTRGLKGNKKTSRIPLIFLTAMDKVGDVDKGFSSGGAAYILKPIDWDRAWTKIERFL